MAPVAAIGTITIAAARQVAAGPIIPALFMHSPKSRTKIETAAAILNAEPHERQRDRSDESCIDAVSFTRPRLVAETVAPAAKAAVTHAASNGVTRAQAAMAAAWLGRSHHRLAILILAELVGGAGFEALAGFRTDPVPPPLLADGGAGG